MEPDVRKSVVVRIVKELYFSSRVKEGLENWTARKDFGKKKIYRLPIQIFSWDALGFAIFPM